MEFTFFNWIFRGGAQLFELHNPPDAQGQVSTHFQEVGRVAAFDLRGYL